MAIIECQQCGAVFSATSDELRYGLALCPSCGNGISTRLAKRAFTAQDVEDAFFATRIQGRVGNVVDGIATVGNAIWEWVFDQVDGFYEDINDARREARRLTEIGEARYARGKRVLRIGKVVSCKLDSAHPPGLVSDVSPSVIVEWRRQKYCVVLRLATDNVVEGQPARKFISRAGEARYYYDDYGFMVDEYGNAWHPDVGLMGPDEAQAARRELDAQDGIMWDD